MEKLFLVHGCLRELARVNFELVCQDGERYKRQNEIISSSQRQFFSKQYLM